MVRMSTAQKRSAAILMGFALTLGTPIGITFAPTRAIKPIKMKDRSEIFDAIAVNEAIDALSRDADSCSARTQTCICIRTAGFDRLNKTYRNAVERHPIWGQPNTGTEYDNLTGRGTVGIVMSNVKRKLAMFGRQQAG